MIQCPQCGNSTNFRVEAVVATHNIFIIQTSNHIKRGGYQKGEYHSEWDVYTPPEDRGHEVNDLSECTCKGRHDGEDYEDDDGCGYSGPLHTFYVDTLKPVAKDTIHD